MALEIFKLVGSIMVDNTKANESLSKTDDKAKGIGQRLASGIGTAAKWGAGIVAAAGAGAAALYGVATKSAAAADEIDKMSQKIGISRTAYQELDFILSQNGMSVDQLQGGMKKLVNTMQSAQDGNKTASATFAELGVSVTDSTGALRNQEDVFYEAIAALQGMENETERNAIANDLFGKSASEMAPLLNAGAGSMEELRQKAHDLGLVLSDETINAGVAFTDTMDQTKRALSSVTTQLGAEVMPIINDLLQWVLSHMPEIQAVIKVCFDAIEIVVKAAGKVIGWLAGIFEKHFPAMKDFVQKAFTAIKGFWDSNLKPCLEAIGNFIKNVLAPVFKTVFNGLIVPYIQSAFKIIGDLWNGTLKPIFTGITDFLTGVFTLNFKQAFQGIATAVGGIFSGIVAVVKAAIGAVIAIGVLLWQNWDTIKAKARELWDSLVSWFTQIKDSVVTKFTELKDQAVAKFSEMKDRVVEFATNLRSQVKEKFDRAKSDISLALSNAKNTVTNTFTQMYNTARDKVTSIYNTIKQKFDSVKTAISDAINSAKNTVSSVFDSIKSIFNTELKIKLKVPHISIDGGEAPWGIDGKGRKPSFDVSWYKKAMDNAMILSDPTIFGMGQNGRLLGGGEAGNEVITGEAHLLDLIGQVVARQTAAQNEQVVSLLVAILEAIASGNDDLLQALREGHVLKVGEREFGRLVRTYA